MDYHGKLPKKYFSKEQVSNFRKVNLADFLEWYEYGSVTFKQGCYRLSKHSSVVFNGEFANFYKPMKEYNYTERLIGIDAVCALCGLSFYQACYAINDFYNANLLSTHPTIESSLSVETLHKQIESRKYIKAIGIRNIWAYLTRRGIDEKTIRKYFRDELIYAEPFPTTNGKTGYNLLFTLRDEDDEIVGFERCGVLSNEDKRYKGSIVAVPKSFFYTEIPGGDKQRVFAFESALDLMSFESLIESGSVAKPTTETWVLISLRGVHLSMLDAYLERQDDVSDIVVCVDADAAGDNFFTRTKDKLSKDYIVSDGRKALSRYHVKDWNALLCNSFVVEPISFCLDSEPDEPELPSKSEIPTPKPEPPIHDKSLFVPDEVEVEDEDLPF